jgi:hypothetical protein
MATWNDVKPATVILDAQGNRATVERVRRPRNRDCIMIKFVGYGSWLRQDPTWPVTIVDGA